VIAVLILGAVIWLVLAVLTMHGLKDLAGVQWEWGTFGWCLLLWPVVVPLILYVYWSDR